MLDIFNLLPAAKTSVFHIHFFYLTPQSIQIPPLKVFLCWRQICFLLVFRATPKPNVQINLQPEVYTRWMFLQQFSCLSGQNITKQWGQQESRNPLNVPWTTVYVIITSANEATDQALTTPLQKDKPYVASSNEHWLTLSKWIFKKAKDWESPS